MKKTLITISHAARLQGVSRQTLYNWIESRGFPVYRELPTPFVCVQDMHEWRATKGMDPIFAHVPGE